MIIHSKGISQKGERMNVNRAVFLDRDGVINEVLSDRVKFVNKPDEFYLLKGVGEAIKLLNEADYRVFVVTNQGGIGLGFMSAEDLDGIHERMYEDLIAFGATIDDLMYCPHQPNEGCSCRKPHPKMIVELAKKHKIDLPNSYMVGDRDPDIRAGAYAGTKTVFVGNRKEKIEADVTFSDLYTFANWLVAEN